MKRVEKLLKVAQSTQRRSVPNAGDALPAPCVDFPGDRVAVTLPASKLSATADTLDTALSQVLHAARKLAVEDLDRSKAAQATAQQAVAAIDAALASKDD